MNGIRMNGCYGYWISVGRGMANWESSAARKVFEKEMVYYFSIYFCPFLCITLLIS